LRLMHWRTAQSARSGVVVCPVAGVPCPLLR
jgi:hypothetical protein